MRTADSPIPRFVRAFGARRHRDLEPFLHEAVVYRVDGFEPVVGRPAVMAYWRRMFDAHDTVRMSLERHVRDGDVVIASQRQLYLSGRRAPLLLDSLVVYQLQNDLIVDWWDGLRAEDLDEADAAVWRRLRLARW